MKPKIIYLFILITFLQGCVANNQTGQMEPGWLFWVFLGLLLGGVFFGVIINTIKKKKPDNTPTKTEQEIESYEEALNKKLNKDSDDKNIESKEFTGWRSIFWPIHSTELKKFLPMALMMMGILFNYSILRGTKDSLVVTNMGAEAIPTLKLWFVLPAAVILPTGASNHASLAPPPTTI